MNIGRIFASAIARRVAYVVVAIVLAWMGFGGEVRAGTLGCNLGQGCTKDQAYNFCAAHAQEAIANVGVARDWRCLEQSTIFACQMTVPGGTIWSACNPIRGQSGSTHNAYHHVGCPAGYEWDDVNKTCGVPCQDAQPLPAGSVNAPGTGDRICQDGCAYACSGAAVTLTIDRVVRTACAAPWNPAGAVCSAGDPAPLTPVSDADGDGSSDDNDNAPNNPGESGDGSGQDDSRACGGVGQPECAEDGSNAGSGNGNTSGGGGNCQSPPTSSGDAILAQIAFQTWATRCALEGNANAGVGTGDGPGEGNGDSPLDKLTNEAAGLDQSQGDADPGDAWVDGPSSIDLDSSGLGFGGSCPAPPTINGQSIDPDGNLCMLVQIIGALVLAGAFAHAGYIIGRA